MSQRSVLTREGGGGQAPNYHPLAASDIPNLDASIVTTGQLELENGGTDADLSTTGGAHQVVMQESVGAPFTVRTLTLADLPTEVSLAQVAALVSLRI